MNLSDLFDEVKKITSKYFDEKVGDANKMFERIEKKIDDMSGKVEGFQDVGKKIDNIPDSLDEKFNGVHENINRTFTKTDEIHRKIGEIPAALEEKFQNCGRKIESGFSEVDGKFSAVEKNISALSADVGKILKIYEDEILSLKKSAEVVPGLKLQIETQQKEISTLTADLNTAQNEKNSLAKELGEKENELKIALENFQRAQEESADAKKSLQTWEEAAEIYKPVRTALNNCETFQKFVEERGLNDNSDAGLFLFVQELGKTIDFVNDIYQVAVELKKNQGNNAQPMTAEETAVYDALNKAYRKIWNIDFDIFTTPGNRKNISEPFEKTAFSNEAINLKDPRNKSLKYTTKIYVPMLLSREGRMYKPAFVEAGNL
ncbi:MAG: hypothetical protein IJU55_02640 [Selenomonadaceae bacterium]|nr:hypothetical protein [Selenomonadaceae bacterium]